MKRVIVTGDDFGLSPDINEAIEEAHRRGILTTASLMVGAQSATDAIERARRLPSLRVGLHLVLVDGSPVLPVGAIPNLLDGTGNFSSHLVRAGIRFFFSPEARRQLEAEVRAQFQAFQRTGLPLDHVNTHHHMHLHPTVSRVLLKVGEDYGLKAVRLPYEPPIASWRASRRALLQRMGTAFFLYPWIILLKKRMGQRGIYSNDFVFGMHDGGNLHLDPVLRYLKSLSEGVTEIYFHPALSKVAPGREASDGQREFEALTSPQIRQTLLTRGIQLVGFNNLEKGCEPSEGG